MKKKKITNASYAEKNHDLFTDYVYYSSALYSSIKLQVSVGLFVDYVGYSSTLHFGRPTMYFMTA